MRGEYGFVVNMATTSDAMVSFLKVHAEAIPLTLVSLYLAYWFLKARSDSPKGLPWVGRNNFWLSFETVANVASFKYNLQWLHEGNEKV